MAFLTPLPSTEIDCKDVCCVRCFRYNRLNGDLLRKPERWDAGKKRYREDILATKIFSQVDVIYRSPDCMKLNDAYEAELLAAVEYHSDEHKSISVDGNEHENGPAEEMA